MNSSLRCFTIVAETLNITASAKKLFLTQQCVSGHIKRLEKQYSALLFHRKQKLALTAAGKALLKTTKEISVIENSLETELRAIANGEMGELNVGIHAGRSRVIMPEILAAFVPQFPKVRVNIEYGETKQFERMLLDGEIDMFLGINAERHMDFNYWHLMDESLYLVVSDHLLAEYLGPEYKRNRTLRTEGADLADFTAVPFIFTHPISRTQVIVSAFLVSRNIHLRQAVTVRDHNLHVSLCAQDLGASICPRMMLGYVDEWNASHPAGHRLNVFPLRYLSQTVRLELITHRHAFLPKFAIAFRDAFVKAVEKYKVSPRGTD
ncbi:MAG: LysR family transcriptional regulator [Deltaproteobacteria bacterium]|nr:LysR family transcriptional regulator [Deltaproteobacteria bacterium]